MTGEKSWKRSKRKWEWRADDWPPRHYSRASFSLKKIKGGTRLSFYQSNVPDEHYAGIKQGWEKYLGEKGRFVGMSSFGASAPYNVLYKHFGITPEHVVAAAKAAR